MPEELIARGFAVDLTVDRANAAPRGGLPEHDPGADLGAQRS